MKRDFFLLLKKDEKRIQQHGHHQTKVTKMIFISMNTTLNVAAQSRALSQSQILYQSCHAVLPHHLVSLGLALSVHDPSSPGCVEVSAEGGTSSFLTAQHPCESGGGKGPGLLWQGSLGG